jgi:hypothetical protein
MVRDPALAQQSAAGGLMLLQLSLDGVDVTPELLRKLADRLLMPNERRPPCTRCWVSISRSRQGAAGITELFNGVVGLVLARQDDLTVVISDQAGRVARIDRRSATNPLELVGMVTMFNPPVGMG